MPGANACLLLAVALDDQIVRYAVWTGLVGLTLTLLVLMRTRWGQSHPLRKCIVLSLLAHLLLGIYTTTVNMVSGDAGPGDGGPLRVTFVASGSDNGVDASTSEAQPWDQLADTPLAELASRLPDNLAPPLPTADAGDREPPRRAAPALDVLPAAISGATAVATSRAEPFAAKPAATIEAPSATRVETRPTGPKPPTESPPSGGQSADPAPSRTPLDTSTNPLEALAPPLGDDLDSTARTGVGRGNPALIAGPDPFEPATPAASAGTTGDPPGRLSSATLSAGTEQSPNAVGTSSETGEGIGTIISPTAPARNATDPESVPPIYQLRIAPDHTRQAEAHGGTRETEAAVVAALRWLVSHQSGDGRWDGGRLEAGREAAIDGHERRGAGTRADTGITGLALLALLASGHTHLEGEHHATVQRGLEYLIGVQAPDGNLGGNATLYEKMYCHAMASFALSEAYAMTHDGRLQTAVRRAIGFTLTTQGAAGGWRYQPGEAGDTSQLGWQFMALKSAELAGIPVPPETREGMIRFLKSVSSGPHGGLASYRPGHRATRTMTAEALVCRQFLGMARSNPAATEAGNYVLEELPGTREANFYYWYYATLGMYQLQDEHWKRWNAALQATLVGSQRTQGDKAGSWDPDPIWGAYGGRAYSTALGALCLEVYYRFLPFYVEAAGLDRQQK